MKKSILWILVLLTGIAASCNSSQSSGNRQSEDSPKNMSSLGPVSAGMGSILNSYYQLQKAMVEADDSVANTAASALEVSLGALPVDSLQADSLQSVHSVLESLKGEIAGLKGEADISGKRQEFQMISDILYDLVKAVRPQGLTVYRQFCPMAFDNKGAFWLSNSEKIRNPYYGHQMLNCGEVKETLSF